MGNVGGGNGTHSHEISHMNVVMDWWLITLGSLFNSTSRGLCVCVAIVVPPGTKPL